MIRIYPNVTDLSFKAGKTIDENVSRKYIHNIQTIDEESRILRNDAFSENSRKAVLKGNGTDLDKEICLEKRDKLKNKILYCAAGLSAAREAQLYKSFIQRQGGCAT